MGLVRPGTDTTGLRQRVARPAVAGFTQTPGDGRLRSMTTDSWRAPDVERVDPPYIADDRAMLQTWLDFHRATLLMKCAGLDAQQLATASAPPSNLTLLGLVRHMSEVERSWFRTRMAAQDVSDIYCTEDQPDADFDNVASAD